MGKVLMLILTIFPRIRSVSLVNLTYLHFEIIWLGKLYKVDAK
jgi:hypothetical protein